MKNIFLILSFALLTQTNLFGQDESAYFELSNAVSNKIENSINAVSGELQKAGFKIIGKYNPANSENSAVVCYTRADLENIALSFTDWGSLAATLKIGFKNDGQSVKISMLNPMYLFYAYFIDGIEKHESALSKISEDAKKAMKNLGSELIPFGGTLNKKKLQKYHYKVMMPFFTDAENLNEFGSFEEGLKTIQANLASGKGDTEKVYQLTYPDKKVAVFGVGLKNTETGESKFLPIIGDDHIAAMPYEIILQGNTASILPGRYRIALHWPELTMGTFMKIMSTPGDIKKTLQGLTE